MTELAVMAKYWEPGAVKTRLARDLGHDRTSTIYRCFVETILRRFAQIAEHRWLLYSPHESVGEFERLSIGLDWQLKAQVDGGLGDRLAAFFHERLSYGANQVVVIGTDSPTLPTSYLEDAFEALTTHDVTLGPTADGGYYLVGMKGRYVDLFTDIPWSTTDVWQATLDRLTRVAPAARWRTLPVWYDVDRRADLGRLRAELWGELVADSAFDDLRVLLGRQD